MANDPNNPFGSIPGLPDLNGLMQQAQRMREELLRSHADLTRKNVEASSGGGMVTAVVSGARELVSLRIDPQVIDPSPPFFAFRQSLSGYQYRTVAAGLSQIPYQSITSAARCRSWTVSISR